MLVVGFGSGPLQANCYLLAAAAGGPCVVVDPGQEVAAPLAAALAEHRLVPAALLATLRALLPDRRLDALIDRMSRR